MKVQIEIPNDLIDTAERLSILHGETYHSEIFDALRTATEPIDITKELNASLDTESKCNQYKIGLACLAILKIEMQKEP